MKTPLWLDRVDALAVHDMILAQHGGGAGLRDEGLLESALHRPRQMFVYGKPDIHSLAAGYAKGIIQNHPFVDGNKRTGFMLAAVFMEANGWRLNSSEESVVIHTVALASREITEAAYARWLRENSQAPDKG